MQRYYEVLEALDARYGSENVDGWLDSARQSLRSLRQDYNQHGQPDYAGKFDRLAYVLAYHPAHRKMAEWSFEHTSAYVDAFDDQLKLNVVILGAGPGAELVELARFIAERLPNIKTMNVVLLDRQNAWQKLRHIVSIPLAKRHFGNRQLNFSEVHADLLKETDRNNLREPLCKADLVISHAVLSEVASAAGGVTAIDWICNTLQGSAIMLMVDLRLSDGGNGALQRFNEAGLNILNEANENLRIGKPPARLEQAFFARKDGLRARQNVSAAMRLIARNAVSVKLAPQTINFTPDQQDAISSFTRFLQSPEDTPIAILRGAAGTGKSTLLRELVRVAFDSGRSPRLLAPTGQASKRLRDTTEQMCTTVHSALYEHQITLLDDVGGRIVRFTRNDFFSSDLLIIDEASLIGDSALNSDEDALRLMFNDGHLLSDILEVLELYRPSLQILFVGDHHQLPPVAENNVRPALDPQALSDRIHASVPLWELQSIVRQAEDSPILATATNCRNGKPLADHTDLVELPASSLSDHDEDLRRGNAVIIAWANNTVATFNREFRLRWGRSSEIPQKGDRLVAIRSTMDKSFINGDEMIVESVGSQQNITRRIGNTDESATARLLELVVSAEGVNERVLMDVLVLLDGIEGQRRDAIDKVERVLTIDARVRYSQERDGMASPVSEMEFLRQDPVFNALRVVYPYARTCHRAQGSEWDTVIVDLSHGNAAPSGWEYTAVTRARQQLYVINKPQLLGPPDIAAELRPLLEDIDLQVSFRPLQHGAQQLTISYGSAQLLIDVYLKQSLPSKIDQKHGDEELWRRVNPVITQWGAKVRARCRPVTDVTISDQLYRLMDSIDAPSMQVTYYKAGQWEIEVDAVDEAGDQATLRLRHNSAGVIKPTKITGEGPAASILAKLKGNLMC